MEAKKYQLKSKYYYALCLGNSSKDFTINNIKTKKNRINSNCKYFFR